MLFGSGFIFVDKGFAMDNYIENIEFIHHAELYYWCYLFFFRILDSKSKPKMILIAQILIILFFIFNMGKLMYDYLDEVKEVKFINMIFVMVSIAALIFLNYLIM